MSHVIRLREPWELLSADASGNGPEQGRRVTLRRRFKRPTGLEAESRVWLVVEGLTGLTRITLNDHPLDLHCDATGIPRSEIQWHLGPHNEIVVELAVENEQDVAKRLAHTRRRVLAAGLIRLEISNQP